MFRLVTLFLILALSGIFSGEPLHGLAHALTGVAHVDFEHENQGSAEGSTVTGEKVHCAFLAGWISLLRSPSLTPHVIPAPEFALRALEAPTRTFTLRSRVFDYSPWARGPPSIPVLG